MPASHHPELGAMPIVTNRSLRSAVSEREAEALHQGIASARFEDPDHLDIE